jgi:hypothetical protein
MSMENAPPELPRDVWLKIIKKNMKYHTEWNEWIRHFESCRAAKKCLAQ